MYSHYLRKNDAVIRGWQTGYGCDWLVFLPGLCFSSLVNFWAVVQSRKLQRHKKLLIDYLGSGVSDFSTNFGYSIEEHADTVASLLRAHGEAPYKIVGHSMGGSVAIHLANNYPELVSKLIVCEGNVSPGGGRRSRLIAQQSDQEFTERGFPDLVSDLRRQVEQGSDMAQWLSAGWANTHPDALHRTSRSLVALHTEFCEQFLSLGSKCTFIYGGAEELRSVAPDRPSARVLKSKGIFTDIVPDAGHNMMFDNLDGFVSVLDRHL